MPTYDYECQECGHRFEAYHSASELLKGCERCQGAVRKLFSPPAIIFKGSGFYTTDYARKGEKPKDDGARPERSRGDGKPAAKPSCDTCDKQETCTAGG